MNYLENIADALLRWAETHRSSRPLCVATARHLLLLAEAELKVMAMSRFARVDLGENLPNDLQTVIHALRHSDRSLDDISRSIKTASRLSPDPRVSRQIAVEAMRELRLLADDADVIGDSRLASNIDILLSMVRDVKRS